MKFRWFRYCSALPLLAACSGSGEGTEGPVGKHQQALDGVFETNKFFGQVGFSNDPSSDAGALLLGHVGPHGCYVEGYSTSVSGLSASTSSHDPGLLCDYELSAETQDGGVTYRLRGHRAGYWTDFVSGQELQPKAVSPQGTQVDITECVGLRKVSFRDCDGNPVEPNSVGINAPYFKAGDSWYAMLRAGTTGSLTVTYTMGTDVYVDTVSRQATVEYASTCDVIEEDAPADFIDACVGEGSDQLGALQGRFQVIGEPLVRELHVYGQNGPDANQRFFRQPGFDSATDEWLLPNMVPGTYTQLWGQSAIRTGYAHTQFAVHFTEATVLAGQTVVPSRAGGSEFPFVMTPAVVSGNIRLWDPTLADLGTAGSFAHLVRAADTVDAAGLPTGGDVGGLSSVTAHSWPAASHTSFAGAFDTAAGELRTTYELPVMSTYDELRNWDDYLTLAFRSAFSAADPDDYRYGNLHLRKNPRNLALAGGDAATRDYDVCFAEVDLSMFLLGGDELFSPRVSLNGSVPPSDTDAGYTVSGWFYGSPVSRDTRSTDARVVFPVPAGTYELAPAAEVVNENGVQASVNFSRLQLSVECGDRSNPNPFVTVEANLASQCAGAVSTAATIRVDSRGAATDRVWYTINDGEEVEVCSSNCGANPSYEIEVPTSALAACTNVLQVYATSSVLPGRPGSVGKTIINDVPGAGCAAECPREGACLVGTEGLDIRDRARVLTSAAGGNVEIGADALVSRNVDAAGNAFVRERANVGGTLSVEGSYSHQNHVVLGGLVHPADVTLPTLASRTVNAATGWQEVPNDAVRTLAPGSYGNMTVRARSTVTLTAGEYHFATLIVEPDVRLVLDTSAGPITLLVQGNVTFESRIRYQTTGSSDVLLYSNGQNVTLHPQQTFPGAILAPQAHIAVQPFVTVDGCIAGRFVRIEADSVVNDGTPVTGGGSTGGSGGGNGGGNPLPGRLQGALTVTSSWQTGYCAEVSVTNTGSAPVTTWNAEVTLGEATVNNSWNGTFAVSGHVARVTPAAWNGTLNAGASASFGFCATKQAPGAQPALVSVQ
jgi:hypothetical protein